MDNGIKKGNPAIEKAEYIANKQENNKFAQVEELNGNEVVNSEVTALSEVDSCAFEHTDKPKEDKKQRRNAEKQAKNQLKQEKIKDKTIRKSQRAEKRAMAKKQRAEDREYKKETNAKQREEHSLSKNKRANKNGNNGGKRGVGGWIAAVVSLGCATLVLSSLLTLSLFTDRLEFSKVNTNSTSSQRAFYDFVGYVDNMETNMAKFFVSSDASGKQRILTSLAVQSNLADEALSELPIMDESKYMTSKYINQVGDYSKYLNNRLIDGYPLTESEINSMRELYKINLNLKKVLSDLSASITESYDFSALSKNDANDLIISQFNEIESGAMEYPSMIYDGAFSDGLLERKPKGIIGEEITELEAQEIFKNLFGRYGIERIEVTGMVENSGIQCYNLISETEQNGEVYAQISKVGGKLIMFNAYKGCTGLNVGEEESVAIAEEFIQTLGIPDMTCVWSYSSGSTVYLNFASDKNGIIAYPDLVKVKVCRERGLVSGIDTDKYYMNHVERQIEDPKYTLNDAYEKVSEHLEIRSSAVAIIPTGGGNEKLAYEFIGDYEGESYYVYIDANTLQEADIFKVVNTAQGRLLI